MIETYETETGTWGWTADGELHCTTCKGSLQVTCPACHGATCDCDRPACKVCADPATECGTCENNGAVTCPTCVGQ
jgi:hypothetical protein